MRLIICFLALFFLTTEVAFCQNNVSLHYQDRCIPSQKCWPSKNEWMSLNKELSGHLIRPSSPVAVCKHDIHSQLCIATLKRMKNPYFLQSIAGGSLTQGYWGAWFYRDSAYAVEVYNAYDVVAAVNFARKHHLMLVVKGAGHDFLGRSNAPNSLLIWTHKMQKIAYHPAFVPRAAPRGTKPQKAVTVAAGVTWFSVYKAMTKLSRFVPGGGCTSVGAVGGFTLGGGFSAFVKKYGTGAANLLQAQVVTANGHLLTVNRYLHKKLFWAIRGGGPGFAVVTQMTYKTYPLPKYFGAVKGEITINHARDYQRAINYLFSFLRQNIINEHWGGYINFSPKNTIIIDLRSVGLSRQTEVRIWRPFLTWLRSGERQHLYVVKNWLFFQIPGRQYWNPVYMNKRFPGLYYINEGNASHKQQAWTNAGEMYTYRLYYNSWWLPFALFQKDKLNKLSHTIVRATRYHMVNFQLNKGLAGGAVEAIKLGQQTSTNSLVYKAAGAIFVAASDASLYPALKPPSKEQVSKIKKTVYACRMAMKIMKSIAPNSGSYVNETSYFEPNWQRAFWGVNYSKLLNIKQRYDPTGLFYCHHCVGSEFWSKDGFRYLPQ